MPATNVKSRWVDGNLVFYDASGDIICTFDGSNRKIAFPTAGTFDVPEGAISKADIGKGVIKTVTEVIDASGGDGDQDIVTVPENSVITDVHVLVTQGFDGDAAQTINIGIEGNTNKYLATADIQTGSNNIAENDEAFASTEDKAPASEASGETVKATWTNSGNEGEGIFRVSVSYYVEDV